MNGKDLDRAIALTNSDTDSLTLWACRMVVEDGMNVYEAARAAGISHPTVYRKMAHLRAALELPVCPTCGQTTDGSK